MPKDRWISLDDKTKATCDSIEDNFKNIILGYTTSSPHTSSFTPHRGKPLNTSFNKSTSKSRKALLHKFIDAFGDELEENQQRPQLMTPRSQQLEPDPLPPLIY
jgi:ribosomal protein S17E